MLTSPSGVTRIVSFPNRLPDSPSAARNQRSASHRCRHSASVSWAASRLWRVLSRRRPPRTTCTTPGLTLGPCDVEAVFQDRQAAGLVEPLALGAVAARRPLAALLADRQGQPVRQRPHTGLKALDVRELAAAGQRPLIVAGLRDRTRPTATTTRPVSALLTGRPRVGVVVQAVSAAGLEVQGCQPSQVLADQPQHLLVLGRKALEPVAYRHPGRRRDETARRWAAAPGHRTGERPW